MMTRQTRYHALVEAARCAILERALVDAGGNRTRAAQALGLQRTYLHELLAERPELVARLPRAARGRRPLLTTTSEEQG